MNNNEQLHDLYSTSKIDFEIIDGFEFSTHKPSTIFRYRYDIVMVYKSGRRKTYITELQKHEVLTEIERLKTTIKEQCELRNKWK